MVKGKVLKTEHGDVAVPRATFDFQRSAVEIRLVPLAFDLSTFDCHIDEQGREDIHFSLR